MKKYLPLLIILGVGLFILWKTGNLYLGGILKDPGITLGGEKIMGPISEDPSRVRIQ